MNTCTDVLNQFEILDRSIANEIGDLIAAHLSGAHGADTQFLARKISSITRHGYSREVAIKLTAIAQLILESPQENKTKEDITKAIHGAILNRFAGNGSDKSTCKFCGFNMPVYPGRYPEKCPQCGNQIGTSKGESIEYDYSVTNEDCSSASDLGTIPVGSQVNKTTKKKKVTVAEILELLK